MYQKARRLQFLEIQDLPPKANTFTLQSQMSFTQAADTMDTELQSPAIKYPTAE